MRKHIFLFVAFACLGITTEIFFTAIYHNIDLFPKLDWSLRGETYIWMFPIYGLAGIAFPLIFPLIERIPFLLRLVIYGIGILIVEFITGAWIDWWTGSCPWEYKEGWHIMGYIRIDYFPLWALFGGLVEKIMLYLQSNFKED